MFDRPWREAATDNLLSSHMLCRAMQLVEPIIASSVGPQIVIWLPSKGWPQFRLGSPARSALERRPSLVPDYHRARQPLDSRGLSSDNPLR
jgi:hypothetical protein